MAPFLGRHLGLFNGVIFMAIKFDILANSKQAQDDVAKLKKSVESIQAGVGRGALDFKVGGNALRGLQDLNGAVINLNKSASTVSSSFDKLATNIAKFAAVAAGTATFVRWADELTNINTRLTLINKSSGQAAAAFRTLSHVALNTRADFGSIAQMYQQIAMASENLGASGKEVTVVVQNVAKAIAIGGSDAQQARAAIIQLGQALSSDRLQGDELRSILENAPGLAQAIAKGLGVTIGQMRMLGAAGKLTAKEVFGAILNQTNDINANFKKVGITYGQAFTNMGNALFLAGAAVAKVFKSSGGTIPEFINNVALRIAQFSENLEDNLLSMRLKFGIFITDIIGGFYLLSDTAKDIWFKVLEWFKEPLEVKLKVAAMRLSDFFPKLESIKKDVFGWVTSIERAFFWLYDRVIGHSWIPDMVQGVIDWMAKLLEKPLFYVGKFAGAVDKIFGEIARSKFGMYIQDAIVSAIQYATPYLEKLGALYGKLNYKFDNSEFGDTVKQVLGWTNKRVQQEAKIMNYQMAARKAMLGEKFTGKDVNRDEFGYVQYGPQRHKEKRFPGHDIVNALPLEMQIPAIATVAAVAIGAVLLAFRGNGPVISVLTGLITTGFGLAVAQTVDKKQIDTTIQAISLGVLGMVKKLTTLLFGEGVFGDKGPLGILSLMAKIALLWKAGRDYMQGVATKIATAPTNIMQQQLRKVDYAFSGMQLARAQRAQRAAEAENTRATALVTRAAVDLRAAEANLTQAKAAQRLFAARGVHISTTGARDAVIDARVRAGRVEGASVLAQAALQRATATREEVAASRKTLGAQIAEVRNNFRQGTTNTFAGAGGALGSLYGFNYGTMIAEQMGEWSGWQKIGFTILSAFAGQAIFSSLGVLLASIFLKTISIPGAILSFGASVGGSILGAFTTGLLAVFGSAGYIVAGIIAGGIAAALIYFLKPDWIPQIKQIFSDLPHNFEEAARQVPKYIDDLKEAINNLAKEIFDWEPFQVNRKKTAASMDQQKKVDTMKAEVSALEQMQRPFLDRLFKPQESDKLLQKLIDDGKRNIEIQERLAIDQAHEAAGLPWPKPSDMRKGVKDLIGWGPYHENPPGLGFKPLVPGPSDTGAYAVNQAQVAAENKAFFDLFDTSRWITPLGPDGKPTASKFGAEGIDSIDEKKLGEKISSAISYGWSMAAKTMGGAWEALFTYNSPLKKARGGPISGPGTGTSDSIPTLLSNGEFVVNAKSTAKNKKLLELINAAGAPANAGIWAPGNEDLTYLWLSKEYDALSNSTKIQRDSDGAVIGASSKIESIWPQARRDNYLRRLDEEIRAYVAAAPGYKYRPWDNPGRTDGLATWTTGELNAPSMLHTTGSKDAAYFTNFHELGHAYSAMARGWKIGDPGGPYPTYSKDRLEAETDATMWAFNHASFVSDKFIEAAAATTEFYRKEQVRPENAPGVKEAKQILAAWTAVELNGKNHPLGNFGLKPEQIEGGTIAKMAGLPGYSKLSDMAMLSDIPFTEMPKIDEFQQMTQLAGIPSDAYQKLMGGELSERLQESMADQVVAINDTLSSAISSPPVLPDSAPAKREPGFFEGIVDWFKETVGLNDPTSVISQVSNWVKDKLGINDPKSAYSAGVNKVSSVADTVKDTVKSTYKTGAGWLAEKWRKAKALFGFASGGFISGPGSGTSDSIPALLSNGEYVVNARSARNNRELLDLINSNINFSRFSSGTKVNPVAKTTADAIKARLKERGAGKTDIEIEQDLEIMLKIFGMETDGKNLVNSAGGRSADGKFYGAVGYGQFRKDAAADVGLRAYPLIGGEVRNINGRDELFGGKADPRDERLSAQAIPAAVDYYLAQKQKFDNDPVAAVASYKTGAKYVQDAIEKGLGKFDLANLQGPNGDHGRGYIDIATNPDIKAPSPDSKSINATIREWAAEGRELFAEAQKAFKEGRFMEWLKALIEKYIPDALKQKSAMEISGPPVADNITRERLNQGASLEQLVREALEGNNAQIDYRIFEKNNAALKPDVKRSLEAEVESIRLSLQELSTSQTAYAATITRENLQASQDRITSILRAAAPKEASIREQIEKGGNPFEVISSAIIKMGHPLLMTEKSLNDQGVDFVENLIKTLDELRLAEEQLTRPGGNNWLNKKNVEALRKRADQKIKDAQMAQVDASKGITFSGPAKEFGTNFATAFQGEVWEGFAAVLKGRRSYKDYLRGLLDSFTNNIVNAFSKSFVDSMFKGLSLDTLFTNMTAGVYDLAGKVGDKLFKSDKSKSDYTIETPFAQLSPLETDTHAPIPADFKAADATAKDGFQVGMGNLATAITDTNRSMGDRIVMGLSGLGSIFKEGLQSLFNGLNSIFSGVSASSGGGGGFMSFLGNIFGGAGGANPNTWNPASSMIPAYADGGIVPGPLGAPMQATVHGGEMVLNAAQQRSLLEGSNSKASNVSTFNINITGDVSRQTRTEIQKMIPHIAGGVNQHNMEKGIR
jgi:tape measure domain-containing protein